MAITGFFQCKKCGGQLGVKRLKGNYEYEELYRERVCKNCGERHYFVEFPVEDTPYFRKSWEKAQAE